MEYVNLLPDTFIVKEVHHERAVRWIFVGLCAVLLMFGYSFTVRRQVATVRGELALLEKQVAEKEELARKLALLEEEFGRGAERQGTVNELTEQPDWVYVLADIAEAAQHNAWLEQLEFTKVKPRRKPQQDEGAEGKEVEEIVEIRFSAGGYAPSNFELANFMAKLERSSYFDNVELNYSELVEADGEEPVMRFEIEGKLL